MSYLLSVFFSEKIFLQKIIKKPFQKIKAKDLNKFVKDKDFSMLSAETQKGLQYCYDKFYLILVRFKGESTTIKSFFWNDQTNELQNPFNQEENIFSIDKICHSNYDFIMFLDTENEKEVQESK